MITDGGLPRATSTVVTGGTGSGKTLLGLQFLVAGAREHGEPDVLVTFVRDTSRTPPFPTLGAVDGTATKGGR